MLVKWEEGKKWQKRVETLKAQCRDKDGEIEKLKKNNEMLRHAVDRSDGHGCSDVFTNLKGGGVPGGTFQVYNFGSVQNLP